MKMGIHGAEEIALEVGADRVVAPPGFLPQPAETLDPSGPVRPHELEIAVERLCLDSTSHRQIAESAGGDPDAMAARILEIVAERGQDAQPRDRLGRHPDRQRFRCAPAWSSPTPRRSARRSSPSPR